MVDAADYPVTPFVGVWIETLFMADILSPIMSHPSWVCGLKLKVFRSAHKYYEVTPFVGVWIETSGRGHQRSERLVTPFVGVWIETKQTIPRNALPTVTPFVGVWIETD